jgi:hypothetical protein
LILPSDFFDSGDSICLSVFFFNLECYACGMTRSIQHLIHLDFPTAYNYNKLSFIVFPLLAFSYSKEIKRVYGVLKELNYVCFKN